MLTSSKLKSKLLFLTFCLGISSAAGWSGKPPEHPLEAGRTIFQTSADTTRTDSSARDKRLRPLPEPRKAMVRSLTFPGLGQLYNGRWWKTPFVYGALGGAVYVAVSSTTTYRDFQDAYVLKLAGEPHAFSNTSLDDARRLRIQRDRYDKRRQSWYIYSVAIYGLQALEALVDAHLQNFDVSEDLSMGVKPVWVMPPGGGSLPGIGLVLRW